MKFHIKENQEISRNNAENGDNKDKNAKNSAITSNKDQELEFNKKNREDFENLMSESSTSLDGYWDSNNPFVKVLLLILAVIIVAGVVYYIMAYAASH